ncbi:MAG: pyridoxamine 5'-phosphate oxidase [bacterium]
MIEYEPDPIKKFKLLYHKFAKCNVPETSAVTLATATADGKHSVRVVLLKGFDSQGFVFYTNLESRKATELRANPHAALCFYWEAIHFQVRVEGRVQQVTDAEADAYFATRPRGSQIGAWASKQSTQIQDKNELVNRFQEYEQKFAGQAVPRPAFWSGYRVIPERIEFWERRENRLHERILYIRHNNAWNIRRLFP